MTENLSKRILIFSVSYLPFVGGAEIAVKELTDRLGDYTFDLVTVNLDGKQKSFEKIGRVGVYRVGQGMLGKYFFPIAGFLKARKLHKISAYNATWSIMANYAGLASLFFKYFFPKVPLILTLQEGDPLPYIENKMKPLFPLFKALFRRADQITAISNYLADWAKTMGAKVPVQVLPNGVDIKKFSAQSINKNFELREKLGFSDKDTVLVTASRLVKKNAIEDIILSLDVLPENVKFLVIGVGPLYEDLKFQVNNLKLTDRVKFLGFIPHRDLPMYLGLSDIFVRPSLSEGMGNSFIEAMAVKLPVIGTAVGGIVDFLKDGETGLICEVKNPRSIAQKVEKLMKDKESKAYIIDQAFKLVEEKYDWNNIALGFQNKIFERI